MSIWDFIIGLFRKKPNPTPTEWDLIGSFAGLPVRVGANSRYAGAIWSLTWGGREFINPEGHGGQLQTAYQADKLGGAWNPTEAGAMADADGWTSTSKVLFANSDRTLLRTSIQPAFWQPYEGRLVTDDVLNKRVTLGHAGMGNVLRHEVTIRSAQAHNNWGLEGLCCYMAFDMTEWWLFDLQSMLLRKIENALVMSNTPGDPIGKNPAICATPDGQFALAGFHRNENHTYLYGKDHQYPKWDVEFFELERVEAGEEISIEAFTIFGTLQQVRDALERLARGA